MSVEVDLPWGGDFSYDATGDLVLATGDAAVRERLIRLVLTSPTITQNGVVIARADDIYHPSWGAGTRAYVGENFNSTNLNTLAANVRRQILADPGVATSPTPSVSLAMIGTNRAQMIVTYYDTSGQQQVLPTFTLSPSGVTGGA